MVVWEEQERQKKEDEKKELEKEMKKKIREKERREIDKEMIKRHRRNQNEIRGQNKFTLEKELRNKVGKHFSSIMNCKFVFMVKNYEKSFVINVTR